MAALLWIWLPVVIFLYLVYRIAKALGKRGEKPGEERGKVGRLTWSCHICKEVRPDDKISVITKPLVIDGRIVGDQNIRYCNDKPECIKQAQDYDFVK